MNEISYLYSETKGNFQDVFKNLEKYVSFFASFGEKEIWS